MKIKSFDDFMNSVYSLKLKIINPDVYKHYLKFKKSQFWDIDELEKYQFKMMKKVITCAYEQHDFYRELYDSKNISPKDFQCIQDIKKFPLVSKEELKKGLEEKKFNLPEDVLWHSTSGSTGEPFIFPIDQDGEKIRKACKMRSEEWYGKYLGTRWLRIWRGGSTSFKSRTLDYLLARKTEIPFYQLHKVDDNFIDDTKLQEFVDKINNSKIKVVDGYVSALTIIAEFALRTGQKMNVHSVVTGAEYLSTAARKQIEIAFNTKVFNRYGGTEIGLMAHECDDGSMRVMADRLFHETIALSGSDKVNDLVITDFTNSAMPFIRYKVGDVISSISKDLDLLSKTKLPELNEIDGRSNDFFILKDGSLLTSHIWHVYFRDKKNVSKFQVKQLKDFSIQVKIETCGHVDIDAMTKDLKSYVPDLPLSTEVVGKISHLSNGKFRHTFSEVSRHENYFNKKGIPPARNISNIAPYKPASNFDIDPFDTLKLDWNESALEVNDKVRKVLIETIKKRNALNWYPPVNKKKLKETIAKYCSVDFRNVEIFPGSDSALEFLCKIFVREGTPIGLVEPTYDQARLNFEISGANLRKFNFKDIFRPTFDELCSQIYGNEKIIYISNPNNPTGFLWSIEDLNRLVSRYPNVLFVIDEAYIEFAIQKTCSPLVTNFTNIIIIRTFSKGLALAGLRIGFLIYPENYDEIFSKVLNVKDVNVLGLIAAQETLNTIEDMNKNIQELIAGRNYACDALNKEGLEVINGEGNFFLLKSRNPKGLMNYMKDKKILVRSRDSFPGLKGYLRISSAAVIEMKKVVKTIVDYES